MHAASIVRRLCLLWAVACLLSCQALRGPEGRPCCLSACKFLTLQNTTNTENSIALVAFAGMLGAQLGSIAHEAFIGWGGETYLPPAATPNAAAPAEPLLPETSGIIAPNDADSATVDQVGTENHKQGCRGRSAVMLLMASSMVSSQSAALYFGTFSLCGNHLQPLHYASLALI
jgi:hypothetical protein